MGASEEHLTGIILFRIKLISPKPYKNYALRYFSEASIISVPLPGRI